MSGKSLIEIANERVPIAMACRLVGVEIDDLPEGVSIKTYCPFGKFYHSDQGKEAAFRIYSETNSAYCFSCKKFFTPVSLVAEIRDQPKKTVAQDLLDQIGYRPLTMAEMWEGAQPKEPEPDQSMLGMALKTYCERVDPNWSKVQFDKEVAAMLTKCLSLLDMVHTAEDADGWLKAAKSAMSRTLGRAEA